MGFLNICYSNLSTHLIRTCVNRQNYQTYLYTVSHMLWPVPAPIAVSSTSDSGKPNDYPLSASSIPTDASRS